MGYNPFKPFRLFPVDSVIRLGKIKLTPEQTPEIELISADDKLVLTSDEKQVIVQES